MPALPTPAAPPVEPPAPDVPVLRAVPPVPPVAGGGSTVGLELRCASDSYKFELVGNVRYQDGEVRGDWSERTRGAAGQVSGRVKGDQTDVRVEGPNFIALLSLITRGDKQSISIKTPSGSQVSEANITLNRRG